MIHRILSIARHTFKQSVRDKVLYNLIVFAFLLIGASILFGKISVDIQRIILVNLGLSAISIFGLLIAIFIGVSLVWREIDRRTLYNILSKPVARWEFVLGKYLGLLLTLLVNTAIMAAGFYLALFYQDRRFQAQDVASLEAIYFILLELSHCRSCFALFLHLLVDAFRRLDILHFHHRQSAGGYPMVRQRNAQHFGVGNHHFSLLPPSQFQSL